MRWAFTSILALAVVLPAHAQSGDQVRVGSIATHCDASTVIGTTQCKRTEPKRETKPRPKVQEPTEAAAPPRRLVGGVDESEVDDFIANYGKPSREAVRAILNPTDENIAAMLQKENAQMAIAAYTAQRRVELTQKSKQINAPALSQADLPSLIGTRVTLLVGPDCRGCEQMLPVVNQLVTEFPSVEARIGVVGKFELKPFLLKTASMGVYLQTSPVSAERARQIGVRSLPALVVGDSRYPSEFLINSPISTALDLEMALVQMRKQNESAANASKAPKGS